MRMVRRRDALLQVQKLPFPSPSSQFVITTKKKLLLQVHEWQAITFL